jgi:hypothetical protein
MPNLEEAIVGGVIQKDDINESLYIPLQLSSRARLTLPVKFQDWVLGAVQSPVHYHRQEYPLSRHHPTRENSRHLQAPVPTPYQNLRLPSTHSLHFHSHLNLIL